MEELQSTQINNGDEFYEQIEAPTFVDLTLPDRYCPDDRYWFCLRVGCDRKHEEEMDSEAIYKNFVTRVMEARSPNVQKKARNRKALSTSMKCPLSAPAKSSKARVSRLAVMSSFSQKIGDTKLKIKTIPKLSSTPNEKAKKSSIAAKALTTPRNKKCLPNPNSFRSVQNPKTTTVQVPKYKVVAKALVFHSPKKAMRSKASSELDTPITKAMRSKASSELDTPITKICEGMKKLQITSQRKRILGYSLTSPKDIRRNLSKPLPSGAGKQLSARKVKSRIGDLLHPQNCKGPKEHSSRCHETKGKVEKLQKCCEFVPREGDENDFSDMKIDVRDGPLDVHSTSDSSKRNEGNGHEEKATTSLEGLSSEENSDAGFSAASGCMNSVPNSEKRDSEKNDFPKLQDINGEGNDSNEGSEQEEKMKPSYQTSKEAEHGTEALACDDKENAPTSIDRTCESSAHNDEVFGSDDKENASVYDENRELNLNMICSGRKLLGQHETCEKNQKVARTLKKTLKEGLTSVATCAQGVKYKKPKPTTNPKPFRLRTDERGILKEANMEKRLHLHTPIKEPTTTIPRFPSANSRRRNESDIQRNEKWLGQSKCENDTNEESEKESKKSAQKNQRQQVKTASLKISTGQVEPKKQYLMKKQKCKENAVQNSGNIPKRTKLVPLKQVIRPHGAASTTKATASPAKPGQLSVIKEEPLLRLKEARKPSETAASSRSMSRGRRPATDPKEPGFHSSHVPKSCSRKVAQVI